MFLQSSFEGITHGVCRRDQRVNALLHDCMGGFSSRLETHVYSVFCRVRGAVSAEGSVLAAKKCCVPMPARQATRDLTFASEYIAKHSPGYDPLAPECTSQDLGWMHPQSVRERMFTPISAHSNCFFDCTTVFTHSGKLCLLWL